MEKKINFRFRDFNVKKYVLKRYKAYEKDFCKPEKPFAEMSLDELRSYVTMFTKLRYSSYIPVEVTLSYGEEREIKESLNKEFDRRVGEDFLKLYNLYDNKLNKPEKWTGEIRYALLSYNMSGHSYTEMSNFYTAYKLLWFAKERGIKVDDIVEMFTTFSRACYWNLDDDSNKDNLLKTQIIEQVFNNTYDINVLNN